MCKLQRITHKLRKAQGLCFDLPELNRQFWSDSIASMSVFRKCLNFSRYEVAVNVTSLSESADTDAVLFVLVDKQRTFSVYCMVGGLVSEVSRLCLSLFVTSYQWMLQFTSSSFCLIVLMLYVQINNFNHIGTISCVPGWTITKQRITCLAPFCNLDETQEPSNGYHENTDLMLGRAFALCGILCVPTSSYALTLHMRLVDALVWLYTCACLSGHSLIAYLIGNKLTYHTCFIH